MLLLEEMSLAPWTICQSLQRNLCPDFQRACKMEQTTYLFKIKHSNYSLPMVRNWWDDIHVPYFLLFLFYCKYLNRPQSVYSLFHFLSVVLQGVPRTTVFFSNAHISYNHNQISKISSLVGRQWTDFYVGINYNNSNWLQ